MLLRTCTLLLLSLLALSAVQAQSTSVQAQSTTAQAEPDTGSTRYLVTTEQVKPEKEQEWLQLQEQEVLPALRKAGVTQRSVYRTVLGNTTEFVSYLPFPDYAEFDGPDPLERALGKTAADDLKKRLNACLLTTQRQLANSQDAFYQHPGAAPALLSTSYRATSGRSRDYMEFIRTEMWPPIRQALAIDYIEGFQVLLSDQGGEVGIYTLNIHYASFAGLEGPSPAAYIMGPEGTREFIRKGTGLITPLGQIIRAYVPQLSY